MCGKTMLFLTVMAAGLLVCIDAAVTQPCDFLSSINITDGQRNATDQSIEYRGITFAPDQYGEFDFVLVNGTKRTPVAKHLRGCPCLKKPCIRLYCLPGRDSRGRRGCNYEAMTTNHTINILDENNHNKSVNIVEHFSYVVDRPCETFVIQPSGEWQLKHTGEVIYDSDLIRDYKGYTIDLFYNERTQSSMAKLLLCRVNPKVNIRFIVLPIAQLVSVVCILMTIAVYAILPDLQNHHGRSLLGYLFSLLFAYTALAAVQINGSNYVQPKLCLFAGSVIYFGFLSAYLWMNIISIDLWLNFRTMMMHSRIKSKSRRSFYYATYAWGFAGLVTLFALTIDRFELPEHLKPGIGKQSCFLKENRISQGIYFFVPLALIITVNAIFFIFTALKIHEVQKSVLKSITDRGDSHRHQSSLAAEKNNYSLFLRLFIIMGVTWLMEPISWAFAPDSMYFLATDIINQAQGLFIFALFVLKPKMLRRIKKRYYGMLHPSLASENSMNTTQSYTKSTSTN